MRSLDEFASRKLAALDARAAAPHAGGHGARRHYAERDGRRLISFSCNDYLNLSQQSLRSSRRRHRYAAQRYGIGAVRLPPRDRHTTRFTPN